MLSKGREEFRNEFVKGGCVLGFVYGIIFPLGNVKTFGVEFGSISWLIITIGGIVFTTFLSGGLSYIFSRVFMRD